MTETLKCKNCGSQFLNDGRRAKGTPKFLCSRCREKLASNTTPQPSPQILVADIQRSQSEPAQIHSSTPKPPRHSSPNANAASLAPLWVLFFTMSFVLLCCSLPTLYVVSLPPQYYSVKAAEDAGTFDRPCDMSERTRMPSDLHYSLRRIAREYVEDVLGLETSASWLKTSYPSKDNKWFEIFEIIVVLKDGNTWLSRTGKVVFVSVNLTNIDPEARRQSIKAIGSRDANGRY